MIHIKCLSYWCTYFAYFLAYMCMYMAYICICYFARVIVCIFLHINIAYTCIMILNLKHLSSYFCPGP